MMRRLYLMATALFWLLLMVLWGSTMGLPGAAQGLAGGAEARFGMEEVARHAAPDDCWMVIRGAVYELSAYLPGHPSRPELVLPWCGRDATQAYETKTRGRPHSPYADELLGRYRIGVLRQDSRH